MASNTSGELPGGITLCGVLSRDGLAVLYEGRASDRTPILVRVLAEHARQTAPVADAFRDAAAKLSRLSHPAIPRILARGDTPDGMPFVAEQTWPSETAIERRQRLGPFANDALVALADLTLDALATAHANGLCHGDLRAERIWLRPNGTVTVFGLGWGRVREDGRATPSEDLRACAALLFTLLTGRAPTGAPVATLAPATPAPLCELVDRGLSERDSRRWPDARALRTALRRAYEEFARKPLPDPQGILLADAGHGADTPGPAGRPRVSEIAASPLAYSAPPAMANGDPSLEERNSLSSDRPENVVTAPAGTRSCPRDADPLSPVAYTIDAPLVSTRRVNADGPNTSALPLGSTFAERYRIESKLGEGGLGHVYRAYDTRLHRHVSLKTLCGGARLSEQSCERLFSEARAAFGLRHPNVVALHDVAVANGIPYVTTELLPGKSLRRSLDEGVSLGRRLRWLRQIADALATAHARGILHRGLTPESIHVGEGDEAKVLDFGLARLKNLDSSSTQEGADVALFAYGTPAYMAPEQFLGLSTAASDQYAWGLVAAELLFALRPQEARLNPARLAKARPSPLGELVLRALSTRPEARFPDMRHVVRRIDRATDRPRLPGVRTTLAASAIVIAALVGKQQFSAPPTPPAVSASGPARTPLELLTRLVRSFL